MTAEALAALTREDLIRLVLSQAETIVRLEAKVSAFEERLGQNSRNTSKPPSSDLPGAGGGEKRGRGRPRKIGRGGQPGHKGHSRSLVPMAEVDRVVPCREVECERRKAPLSGEDPHPLR